jgi:signal transduction histidine kinase
MTMDSPGAEGNPPPDYNPVVVWSIFNSMRDYICVHRPVFGVNGEIIDCELISWNTAYEKVRTKKVERGQRIVDTYFLPESALAHVNTAWTDGHSYQLFNLNPDDGDRYRPKGSVVAIEVQWQRAGNFVLEIGSDLSEFQQAQNRLQRHEAEVAHAEKAVAIAEDRERIARDLHDSVIQNLFAVSLTIEDIGRLTDDPSTRERLEGVRTTITDVITEIRHEIFDVRNTVDESLEEELQSLTRALSEATGARITVNAPVHGISTRLRTNVRAVVREASANAVRHGDARRIDITADEAGGILTLLIDNDGAPLPEDSARQSGTLNMAERAGLLGGVMTLANTDDGLVRLTWRVPMEHEGRA